MTTAIILIVPYPDATITPVDTLCANVPPVTLTAHDPGGTWSGKGVTGNTFNPAVAGPGNHRVRYDITNADGCSDSDRYSLRSCQYRMQQSLPFLHYVLPMPLSILQHMIWVESGRARELLEIHLILLFPVMAIIQSIIR